jgi:hypothetical protein
MLRHALVSFDPVPLVPPLRHAIAAKAELSKSRHFLISKDATHSPSLYDRDAYQAVPQESR